MKISSWGEHKAALQKIDSLIAEGFEGNAEYKAKFSTLALAVEQFEDSIPLMLIRVPETLPGMVQVKMAEHRMQQQDMAK